MTLRDDIAALVTLIEGISVPSGPSFRRATSPDDIEGPEAERAFRIFVTGRVGPLGTSIDPRVDKQVALLVQIDPYRVDEMEDSLRLDEEASRVARAIELAANDVLVGQIEYATDGTTFVATIPLQFVTREGS